MGLGVRVDPVHCDLEGLNSPGVRVFDVCEIGKGVKGVLLHDCPGLGLKEGAEGVVERAFDAIDWVLIEGNRVEVRVEVHISAIGCENMDKVA